MKPLDEENTRCTLIPAYGPPCTRAATRRHRNGNLDRDLCEKCWEELAALGEIRGEDWSRLQ